MAKWNKIKKQYTPTDNLTYIISEYVVLATEKILKQYGEGNDPSEGLVYWAGQKKGNEIIVSCCIAPKIKASRYNIGIDHYANLKVVEALTDSELIHIGQVHSHPSDWVDHSSTDDECAAFKVGGLLSVVIPNFCNEGMLPFTSCGIHRYDADQFKRLPNTYIKKRFLIVPNIKTTIIDLRHEK